MPSFRPAAVLLALAIATSAGLACGGGGSGGTVQSVTVTGTEMRFDPAQLALAPGRYRFHFVNVGTTYHDLGIYRDGRALGIRETGAGQSVDLDVIKLAPGAYTMECHEPGHLQAGMRGTITVRKPS
jgi:plastocyanin